MKKSLLVVLALSFIAFAGCSKTEAPANAEQAVTTEQAPAADAPAADAPAVEEAPAVNDEAMTTEEAPAEETSSEEEAN